MKNKYSLRLWIGIIFTMTSLAYAAIYDQPANVQYQTYKDLHDRLENGETSKQIEDVLPKLHQHIASAKRLSQARWAYSQNYDEFAKQVIVEPKVLQHLGVPEMHVGTSAYVFAGVMHTYGYLFSTLMTSFGLKGKRWVESRIDERLGLDKGMFSPTPPKGEFLKNLTEALDALGKNKKRSLGFLEEHIEWLVVNDMNVETHSSQRLKSPPTWAKKHAKIKTMFFKLDDLPESDMKEKILLVYQVQFQDENKKADEPLYVTAFPINEEFMDNIKEQKKSIGASYRPRYNLFINPQWKVIRYENLGFSN